MVCGTAQAAGGAPVSFSTPHEAVAALYRLATIPIAPVDKQRFFSVDFAAALIADSDRDDEVGIANDGDYRYDAQDFRISDLRLGNDAGANGAATLPVVFRNFGKPGTVIFDLCLRRPGDWRIKDVTTSSLGSLRRLLRLSAARQTKVC
jgi:hypothetical protein